jgi:uncharacterized membrane protein
MRAKGIQWRKGWPWLIMVVLSLTSFVFLRHNAVMYQDRLAEVTQVVADNKTPSTDQFNNEVTQHQQTLRVVFLNGAKVGASITIANTADSTNAITQVLKVGDQIFLTRGSGSTWQFKTMKRDSFWVPILIAVLGALVILMGKGGRLTVISLSINVGLFVVAIYLDLVTSNGNIFWIMAGFSLLASVVTFGLVLGFRSRLMWTVLATVLTTTAITLLLTVVVFSVTHEKGLHFELMSYLTQLPQPLFYAMTLVGILGAVMDESTDMIATLTALEESNPAISLKELALAGRHVGQEIFGALSNVLFLIFIAEQIPMAVLYLRNGNNWGYTYTMNMSLGMVQTLISAIGIVLTVPIGIAWVAILRRKREVA